MRNMHFIAVGLATFTALLSYSHESSEVTDAPFAKKVLAVQLMPNWDSPITFAIATEFNGEITALKHVSQRQFILIGSGKMKHAANPEQRNFFQENGIENCDVTYDNTYRVHHFECNPVNDLWKLRYQEALNNPEEKGWSHIRSAPDAGQLGMLGSFGITRLNDFIFDEDVFDLLKAINDPAWVNQYK